METRQLVSNLWFVLGILVFQFRKTIIHSFYNPTTAIFNDTTTVAESEKPLHSNSRAIYKPNYETSHMRTRNNSVIQLVSVFGIAYVDTSMQNEAVTHLSPTLTLTLDRLHLKRVSVQSHLIEMILVILHIIPPRERYKRILLYHG